MVCQEISAEVFHVCSAEDSAEEISAEDSKIFSKMTLSKMSLQESLINKSLNMNFTGKEVEMRCLVRIIFVILLIILGLIFANHPRFNSCLPS